MVSDYGQLWFLCFLIFARLFLPGPWSFYEKHGSSRIDLHVNLRKTTFALDGPTAFYAPEMQNHRFLPIEIGARTMDFEKKEEPESAEKIKGPMGFQKPPLVNLRARLPYCAALRLPTRLCYKNLVFCRSTLLSKSCLFSDNAF